MRKIESHIAPSAPSSLRILASEEVGPGGAPNRYMIACDGLEGRIGGGRCPDQAFTVFLNFQHGPIQEEGTNGLTNEALLAVVIDRLESFQRGPFACPENGLALNQLKNAMQALHDRTAARAARGVEGELKA